MRILSQILLVAALSVFTACHQAPKNSGTTNTINGEILTATGVLQNQGFTTYMYGTHLLGGYVLESTTIDLNPYVGARVKITAVNTHYQVEQGPEMYDVTAITRVP